ncbi:MAG TPA: TIR domain-containing protein [Thiobacillaceae bacterium]|nr:TIR domain-containing protein [Thiobacillaceae bacterium]
MTPAPETHDIFISYASEDRERARTLALALEKQGWSVWWDREIPLGRSYDDVIEEALDSARCMLVLWTTASAASEWVRSEASEGKRRGILVPVFLEEVEAPLAFRLLNGAQLWNWNPAEPNAEFDRLTQRVAQILAQAPGTSERTPPSAPAVHEAIESHGLYAAKPPRIQWKPAWAAGGAVIITLLLMTAGYFWFRPAPPPPQVSSAVPAPGSVAQPNPPAPGAALPGNEFSNLQNALKPLVQGLASPGSLALRAFKIPALGLDIAYVGAEQAQATGGTLPTGAVVWAVSDGPAQQAGLQVFDVVTAIDGREVRNDKDLRRLIAAMGPGRHSLGILRAGAARKLTVNCPGCEPAHKVAVASAAPSKPPRSSMSSEAAAPAPKTSAPTPPSHAAVSVPASEAPAAPLKPTPPPVKVAIAAPRPGIVIAALGLPIPRKFWSGENSATYSRKMQGMLQRTTREVLHLAPRAADVSQSEFDGWWNESRDHARSRARCAEPDAPAALLTARMESPPAFSTIESAYWPELQLRLWVCSKQMGYRQLKVLTPNRDDEWPFSVELGAETERFLREHRADVAD